MRYLLLAISVILGSCVLLPSRTQKIRKKNSISELKKLEINGTKQHLLIRGDDTSNPVVLFLHGGPGMPSMFLAHEFQNSWEEHFTMIHWDRRGVGKSYSKKIDSTLLSDSTLLGDLDYLVSYLKERFNKEKIVLLGHSWGSYLGMQAIHQSPENYSYYIGMGQVVDNIEAREEIRKFIRSESIKRNRPQAIEDLEKYDRGAFEKWLFKFNAELKADTSINPLIKIGLRSPEYSLSNALKIKKGSMLWQKNLVYKLSEEGSIKNIKEVDVPVCFISGKNDMTTPKILVREYCKEVSAPEKSYYELSNSAHFPFLEQQDSVLSIMISKLKSD